MAKCSVCGGENRDGVKFCEYCGSPFVPEGAPQSQPKPPKAQAEQGMPSAQAVSPQMSQGAQEPAPRMQSANQEAWQSQPVQKKAPQNQSAWQEAPRGQSAWQESPQSQSVRQEAPQSQSMRQEASQSRSVRQEAPQGNPVPPQGTQQNYIPPKPSGSNGKRSGSSRKGLRIGLIAAGIVLLAVIVSLVFGGKGKAGKEVKDPNLGMYLATTVWIPEYKMKVDAVEMFDGEFGLELLADGVCTVLVEGEKLDGTWKLEGDAITISSKEVFDEDVKGTLKDGVMELDVTNDGSVTTLVKESGAGTGAAKPKEDGKKNIEKNNAPSEKETDHAEGLPGSDLAAYWNNTFYGVFYVTAGTGAYEDNESMGYDAYMDVEVNEDGKGSFSVYLEDDEDPIADGSCHVTEEALYAEEGSCFGEEMNVQNWMMLSRRDYPDAYMMTDIVEESDGSMEFTLYFKPWGVSWQKEIKDDMLLPPSVSDYEEQIAGNSKKTGQKTAKADFDSASFVGAWDCVAVDYGDGEVMTDEECEEYFDIILSEQYGFEAYGDGTAAFIIFGEEEDDNMVVDLQWREDGGEIIVDEASMAMGFVKLRFEMEENQLVVTFVMLDENGKEEEGSNSRYFFELAE